MRNSYKLAKTIIDREIKHFMWLAFIVVALDLVTGVSLGVAWAVMMSAYGNATHVSHLAEMHTLSVSRKSLSFAYTASSAAVAASAVAIYFGISYVTNYTGGEAMSLQATGSEGAWIADFLLVYLMYIFIYSLGRLLAIAWDRNTKISIFFVFVFLPLIAGLIFGVEKVLQASIWQPVGEWVVNNLQTLITRPSIGMPLWLGAAVFLNVSIYLMSRRIDLKVPRSLQ